MRFASEVVLADVVTLLVEEDLVDLVVAHEVVVVILVGQFDPLFAVNAALLVVEGAIRRDSTGPVFIRILVFVADALVPTFSTEAMLITITTILW